ncbi:MAG TPA: DUF2244 domain-containing protein [Gammaproteobacteria bacterium]|nr:DUF2244 domain-containing protein [Gammaproteobacteria bacterium]
MPIEPDAARQRIVIVPNRSITATGLWFFFAGAGAAALPVALWFTLQGFWPVLGYALLELGLLALCLRACWRHGRYGETILICGDRLVVEKGDAHHRERQEYNRYWAQLVEQVPESRLHPRRLLIRSHGHECEVGVCLNEAERGILKRRLTELMRPAP